MGEIYKLVRKYNMNNFICKECGTKYQSPEKEPPPGIKWSDGHICEPVKVEEVLPTDYKKY